MGAKLKEMRLFHWSITYVSLLFVAVAVDPFLARDAAAGWPWLVAQFPAPLRGAAADRRVAKATRSGVANDLPVGSILAWQTPSRLTRAPSAKQDAKAERRAAKLAKQISSFAQGPRRRRGTDRVHRPEGRPDRPRRRGRRLGRPRGPHLRHRRTGREEVRHHRPRRLRRRVRRTRSRQARTSGPAWQASNSAARATPEPTPTPAPQRGAGNCAPSHNRPARRNKRHPHPQPSNPHPTRKTRGALRTGCGRPTPDTRFTR